MWEGLARTRRQDQVLHGAAKLANVFVGIVLLPLWLLGQLVGGRVRDFMIRLERRSHRKLPVPPERERSMRALMADLEGLPQNLERHPFAELRFGFADISNFVVAQQREGAVLGYRYPAQFDDHVFEGADGERIAASIALQEAARPAVIVVHGLFTSSRFDYVRHIAVQAYYEWGFNVAALDLRSFGMTELTSPAPSTAGWKEGQDIAALGAYLKQLGATSVGALGISLGGSSVLNACHLDDAAELARRRHPRGLAAGPSKAGVGAAFRAGAANASALPDPPRLQGGADVADSLGALAPRRRGHAEGAGEGLRPLLRRQRRSDLAKRDRPRSRRRTSKVPLLILHPEDDHIVKVDQAGILADAAAGNDLVRVWILPHGQHGLLETADRRWTQTVYRSFFERWGHYAEREADRPAGEPTELVYSAAQTK